MQRNYKIDRENGVFVIREQFTQELIARDENSTQQPPKWMLDMREDMNRVGEVQK